MTAYDVTSCIKSWDGSRILRLWIPLSDAARLLLPFTERAFELPSQAEQVMREGLAFLAEFGGGPAEDEPALLRSARRYLDRNYPVGVAA